MDVQMTRVTPTPSKAEILCERDRIVTSELFASSQRMCAFLDYLISETVADRASRLKELSIGIAVFGRDATFDPRVDSIVRVEAGRLRAKLREYFQEAGADDPVRITIPKGAYVPVFELRGPTESLPPHARGPKPWPVALLATLGLVALAAIVAVFALRPASESEGSSANVEARSIAVLPLRDWSPDPPDYFSEAMTDVLIARLSERSELRVTSLGSVMVYKDSGLPPAEIAERLGVSNIVEGAVFRENGNVRITANLIDAPAGRNIWSHTFTRPMTDVLALQADVAAEIASQLVGSLLPSARGPQSEISPAAYEAFLKGVYWRNRLTAQGFNRGIVFFQQALKLQNDYAEAYAGLAACHCQLGGHGIEVVTPRAALPEALQLASRALELDDTLAEPYAVIGIIKFKYEWDAEAAEQYLQQAVEKKPSLFEAYQWRSQIAEGTGRHELAVEQARIAHRLNPLSLAANLNLGWQLYQAGRLTEAESEFESLLEFDPDFWGGHWGKAHCLRERGELTAAIAEFARAVDLGGGHNLPVASLGYTYAVAGERDAARAILKQLRALSEKTYVSPVHVAMVHAGLGESDAALEWLDKGLRVRARSMAWLTEIREFESLRDDPRYDELIATIGIAPR
jgi:TolB-like protein/Flp pilus assembly protein TadD